MKSLLELEEDLEELVVGTTTLYGENLIKKFDVKRNI